jgi:hypothetical protein
MSLLLPVDVSTVAGPTVPDHRRRRAREDEQRAQDG